MADTEPDCEFCAIATGGAEAHRVNETDEVDAFLDVNSAVEAQICVAPKPHVEDIVLAEPEPSQSVFRAVQTVGEALEAALGVDAHTVVHTSGSLVGTVEHAQVHLLPRTPEAGVGLALSRSELDPDRGAALADRLREAR
jgi:histidine triad (HIT) family protein